MSFAATKYFPIVRTLPRGWEMKIILRVYVTTKFVKRFSPQYRRNENIKKCHRYFAEWSGSSLFSFLRFWKNNSSKQRFLLVSCNSFVRQQMYRFCETIKRAAGNAPYIGFLVKYSEVVLVAAFYTPSVKLNFNLKRIFRMTVECTVSRMAPDKWCFLVEK